MYAKYIRQYCKSESITQKEFAKRCGVSLSTVDRWLRGSPVTNRTVENKLKKILGLSTINNDFMEDNQDDFYICSKKSRPLKSYT